MSFFFCWKCLIGNPSEQKFQLFLSWFKNSYIERYFKLKVWQIMMLIYICLLFARGGEPTLALFSFYHFFSRFIIALQGLPYIHTREHLRGKYHCTIDPLFDWFGISCMRIEDFCFYLQSWLIQTGQTGGQLYSDTPPFVFPVLTYAFGGHVNCEHM